MTDITIRKQKDGKYEVVVYDPILTMTESFPTRKEAMDFSQDIKAGTAPGCFRGIRFIRKREQR